MPEALPAVSELKSLETELQTLKTKLKERGKKAGADIKVIEESMRRMKESEKGKAKSVDKVKRERDCTCILQLRVSTISSCYVIYHCSFSTFSPCFAQLDRSI